MATPEDEILLTGGGRTVVRRRGDVVIRDAGPWSPAVLALLRHLEAEGFSAAPRVVGSGFDASGRETLTFIEGEFTQPGRPVALIDWETAGPVDPLTELAQVCWLNAKLHDDVVAEREGLPSLADRARQLGAMVDAYGLSARQRRGFFDRIVEFVVSDTAAEADDAGVTPELTAHPAALWAVAWRARSAAWLLRHRGPLEAAVAAGAS
jgi:hypothetical protein